MSGNSHHQFLDDSSSLDALCYIDRLEWSVRHPLGSLGNYQDDQEEEISDPYKRDYQALQTKILERQIKSMIDAEMEMRESLHPNTISNYEPTFYHSKTNLSEHFHQMIEKQDFIPFMTTKEKEQYITKVKESEPLYYY